MLLNWTSRTSAANNNWNSVCYGNGLFVAVAVSGTDNRVMTSPDGITWTSRTSTADNNWNSVCYGNGLFVAVAGSDTDNRVMTSPDGITWTSRTSATDNNWNSVCYGNGLFVAVAGSGTDNRVMTSPDGITWTSRTSAADNIWNSVCYGNELFVAVNYSNIGTGTGSITSNMVMISPDGINWTGYNAPNEGWDQIVYGNGLFVTVNDTNTTYGAMTSPDGINWTLSASPQNLWQGLTYYNGLFVAVGYANNVNTVMTGIQNASCYNEGTKILCYIDEKEEYIEIEKLKIGDYVKTYIHGYKKIKLIGNKLMINNPNKNYNCMYNYKDNILSGGHYLMVDNIDGTTKRNNILFYSNCKNMIDDKYCLLVCDHNESIKITELKTFNIYHLVLEGEKTYCIYIENDVLSESTNEINFYKHNFYH